MNRTTLLLRGFLLVLLTVGLAACDALEDAFENEQEAQGVIEALATDGSALTMDGIDYRITADTEYDDGLDSFADLSVGLEVEIEYEEDGGARVALEIEDANADDDD